MITARPRATLAAVGGLIGCMIAGLTCGQPAGPVPTTPLAGSYSAASMVRQQDDLSDELVELGARFDLVLLADSTLSGHVVLPANLRVTGESEPVDQDLRGQWSLRRNQIRLRFDRAVLGNQLTLAAVEAGLVGTLVVPDPVNGTFWIRLFLVRTDS